jgi:hypothetical protein
MPLFSKPKFPFTFDVDTEIKNLKAVAAMFRRTRSVIVASLLIGCPTVWAASLQLQSGALTVIYESGYEADAAFAQEWWGAANRLADAKYHVQISGYVVTVAMHSEPTPEADTSRALVRCCTALTNGTRAAAIEYLSPSAPAWKVGNLRSSLGSAKISGDYHAKVLMSEYAPLIYRTVQDRRTEGWRGDAPQWFVQGLEEYDAIYHTTEYNRTETATRLLAWAQRNRAGFQCCDGGLQTNDPYNGGATFMAFLANAFGEDVHRGLLASSAPTFRSALETATKPLNELFADFLAWLDRQGR